MRRDDPEPKETEGYQDAAIAWVGERGGCAACARSVLRMSLSAEPEKVKAALKRAGAPVGTYGLINVEVHALSMGAQVDEGGEEWWNR